MTVGFASASSRLFEAKLDGITMVVSFGSDLPRFGESLLASVEGEWTASALVVTVLGLTTWMAK